MDVAGLFCSKPKTNLSQAGRGLLGLFFTIALFLPRSGFAATYLVDGPGRLTQIATQIASAAPGGIHVVRFKTYADVGAFNLAGLNADSLIFERFEPNAQVVEYTGKLFKLENINAPVVFRGLAFRAVNEAAQFIETATGSPNRNLLIDSCQIFGDRFNSVFLSWNSGDTDSRIEIRRSYIVANQGGAAAKIDFTAKDVVLVNNHFNFPGLFAGKTAGKIEMHQNTVNRMQFQLNGNFTGVRIFVNNIFAHPPVDNRLPGGAQKFTMTFSDYDGGGSRLGNVRFNTWAGYNYPASESFLHPSNVEMAPFGDSLTLWDFRPADDDLRGYTNPDGAFPAYNVFPGDTLLAKRLAPKDSLVLRFPSALIPRSLQATYAIRAYPSALDSTRTFWLQDTALQISGPVAINSVTFPEADPQGAPLLFSQTENTFTPQTPGPLGSLVFTNASAAARIFIPAFAGQNTPRGSNITPSGLPSETSVQFDQITRAGITTLSPPESEQGMKRIRQISRNQNPLGVALTTNAEGSESIRIGLAQSDATQPWLADSLAWRLEENPTLAVKDSVDQWWGTFPFAQTLQALLMERLALGSGYDTLHLPQGHAVLSKSVAGHQLQIDSTLQIDLAEHPHLGALSQPFTSRWPGRAEADSLQVRLKKTHPRQAAFFIDAKTAIPLIALHEDSSTVTVALSPTDSGKVLALARKFLVPSGIKTDIAIGADSALGLLSSQPGNLLLDSLFTPVDFKTDTLRLLAKRDISQDNLKLQDPYTLVLSGLAPNRSELVKAYVQRNGTWVKQNLTFAGKTYRIDMQAQDQAVLAVETLLATDTLPVYPQSQAEIQVANNRLTLTPVLSQEEKSRLKAYFPEITVILPNGQVEVRTPSGIPGDSAYTLDLPEGLVLYRLGYQSYSDVISWDTTAVPVPVSVGAFRDAVNAVAPKYPERVKSLVGFPHTVELGGGVLAALTKEQAAQSNAKEWQGEWKALPNNANLTKGKGYLLAIPAELKASLATTYQWMVGADTLALEKGWNIISNPTPIPFSDADIQLDPALVSYFQGLIWEGSGTSAQPVWSQADTLQPFTGYAVHAEAPTSLVFNPIAAALAKKVAPKQTAGFNGFTMSLTFSTGGRSQLTIHEGRSHRPSPAIPFFREGFRAAWNSGRAATTLSVEDIASLDNSFTVHVPRTGEVKIQAQPVSGKQKGLTAALWDPAGASLTPLENEILIPLAQGAHTFRILSVPSGSFQQLQKTLLADHAFSFMLAPNAPNPFSRQTRISFSIPHAEGPYHAITLDILDMTGKIVYQHQWKNLGPGKHSHMLETGNWTSGRYISRLTGRTASGTKVLQRPMLHLKELP